MKPFFYPLKWNGISRSLALGLSIFLSCSIQAQVNVPNSRPTLDPIPDHTTSVSTDVRYIDLNGITPGEETDQQVSIDVSTEDKDLVESIGVDFVDNGKAVINYLLKAGAAGTATVKVVVKDNGATPSSFTRTFHIIIEALNRDLPTKSLLEETVHHHLKAVPNPALVSSRVFFSTPNDEQSVVVDLYTLSGSKVKQLFTGSTLAGQPYYVDVNSRNLAAGVYIVRLTGQSHTSNLRLVVAK
jgi:hypothetical protein